MEELALQSLDQNKITRDQTQPFRITARENQQNHRGSPVPMLDGNADGDGKVDNKLIDLNARPNRGQASNNQVLWVF